MSNVERGNRFRDTIRDLCVAAGYTPITEYYISGKKSDIIYSVPGRPRTKRVAIEAKTSVGRLQKSTCSQIIADYLPSLQGRLVDEIWVVSDNEFSAEARHGLELQLGFFALTYEEFVGTLIDFPRYLQFISLEIQQDGILEYYIPQRFAELGSAVTYINRWLRIDGAPPLAVLSTYGMGKSSLAKMLAHRYASEATSTPLNRIPILIRLGSLSSQQQIDGLLGTMFTSIVPLAGYTFPLFQRMNEQGRFLLLLDGLDEMRYAMTWDDFQYNMDELSRIILPKTKAILFGRPNVFRSAQEYDQVILGKRYIGEVSVAQAGKAVFNPLEIEKFTVAETYEFIERYVGNLVKADGTILASMAERLIELRSLGLDELISRPVHAQMIADIVSDGAVRLKRFSRPQLYYEFVKSALVRDFRRRGNRGLTPDERHKYMRILAWRLWFELRVDAFRPGDVELLITETDGRRDGLQRELLSGPLLESKAGGHFFFSHRSFQEFLISEQLLSEPQLLNNSDKIELLTPEIVDFVADADGDRLAAFYDQFFRETTRYYRATFELAYAVYRGMLRKGVLESGYPKRPIDFYCVGRGLGDAHEESYIKLADLFDDLIDKNLGFTFMTAKLLLDLRAVREGEKWRNFIHGWMISFFTRQVPLSRYKVRMVNDKEGVVDVDGHSARGIGGEIMIEASSFHSNDGGESVYVCLDLSRYLRVLRKAVSAVMAWPEIKGDSDSVVMVRVVDLGRVTDSSFTSLRDILRAWPKFDRLTFMKGVEHDEDSYFDPPNPSA